MRADETAAPVTSALTGAARERCRAPDPIRAARRRRPCGRRGRRRPRAPPRSGGSRPPRSTSAGSALTTFMRCPATWQKIWWRWNSGTTISCAARPVWARSTTFQTARRRRRRGVPSSIAHIRPSAAHVAHDLVALDQRARELEQQLAEALRRARRGPRARSPRAWRAPAAAAMSLPPKVEPWRTPRSMPSNTRSRTCAETSTPPIGTKPPDSALATQIMSGSRPQCSSAKKRPVRPRPVWTSSQTNSVPVLAAGRWAPAR